jgi:exodeoxyribonuclease VII large subunit
VQGDPAPGEIVRAIELVCRIGSPDVIIVARGGGSLEDLWAFNDERVVRAIASCPVPVITGIGHETDFTLSDFASDVRAPTPTGAAVLATPDRADLASELFSLTNQLESAVVTEISGFIQNLEVLRQRLERSSPDRRVQDERQAVDSQQARAVRHMRHMFELRRARLDGMRSRLEALNPSAILKRGFALIQDENGRVIRGAGEVRAGDALDIHLHDGKLAAHVDAVWKKHAKP